MSIRPAIAAAIIAGLPCTAAAADLGQDALPYAAVLPAEVAGATPDAPPAADGMTSDFLPGFGYTADQRLAWLDECQHNQMPADRQRGGLIGGVLGGVIGGLAGNRIAGRGSRTVGTVAGGALGAAAGAAMGTRAERREQDDEAQSAMAFCEDYLAYYEASAQVAEYRAPQYQAAYAAADTPRRAYRAIPRPRREQVIEEWVEEVPPAPPPAMAKHPASKRIPVK